jgi:hypothetical protein
LGAGRKAEGTSARPDVPDSDRNSESARGRSREKVKGKNRDLSNALIKVSEVFGLESEERKDSRDGWKEFKKGPFLPNTVPVHSVPHSSAAL